MLQSLAMRRALLLGLMAFLLASALAVGAGGCTGKGATSPTPQCTPPPAVEITLDLTGQNAQAFASKIAAARFVEGTANQVAFCTTTLVASMGTFTLGGQASSPFLVNPHLELILNTEGATSWAFGTGDSHYAFDPNTDGSYSGTDCDSARTWTVPFDHATATQSAVAWPLGTRCP